MPKEFSRVRRVEEQIRRQLATLIHNEVRELGVISISEVKVSADFSRARVFISFLQDDAENTAYSLNMLQSYAGKLRHLLDKTMRINRVPELLFVYDDLMQRGAELSRIIENAVQKDRKKAGCQHSALDHDEENNG